MNKKTGLVVLVIVLVGVLVYVLSSGSRPDMPPAVAHKSSALPASAGLSVGPSVGSEQSTPTENPSFPETENSTGDGTVASPATQRPPALEPEIRAALGKLLDTSSEGLVEETRNGVTSVDLQGRFQTVPVATIDEQGEARIVDYSSLPEESPE